MYGCMPMRAFESFQPGRLGVDYMRNFQSHRFPHNLTKNGRQDLIIKTRYIDASRRQLQKTYNLCSKLGSRQIFFVIKL